MSRQLLLIGSCLLFCAPAAPAQNQLPATVLQDIKAATVFVKVKAGPLQMSGSGFLMLVKDDLALIVTNEHVVTPPVAVTQRGTQRRVNPTIEVVFNSGRKTETVVKAEVLAADPYRDLAILEVHGAKDLPKPLDLAAKVEPVETMPVYMFGFPFGEALSTSRGNPAITVGKDSVSSIREDDRGDQKVIQIDGDLNPGNSGGPVVDAKGRLIGVAVAKLRGTHIGLAIPPGELTKLLNGRVSGVSIKTVKVADGMAELRVEVRLIDPLNKVGKAALRYTTADPPPTLKANADGRWPPLPGETADLKIDGQAAVCTLTLKMNGKQAVRCVVQPVITNGASDVVYLQPGRPHTINPSKTTEAAAEKPAEPAAPVGAGPAKAVGGLTVKEVSIGSGPVPACLCWAPDGKSFYHLDGRGVVRLVDFETFKEKASFDTSAKCTWLSLSAEGVVVSNPDAQELRLLDMQTLKPIRKAPIAKAMRAVSAPASSYAYAGESEPGRSLLSVIDLKTGKIVRQIRPADFGQRRLGFDNMILSADGKRMFTTEVESICRFSVNGAKLRFDEQSARLIQGRFEGLCISPDGQFVCAPSGGGNYNVEGERRGNYQTYVYKTNSLKKAVVTLEQGAYPTAVGFDRSGLFYAQNHEHQLIVFDAAGIKLKEHSLTAGRGSGGTVKQYLVHPDGRKLLILTEDGPRGGDSKLWYVEVGEG